MTINSGGRGAAPTTKEGQLVEAAAELAPHLSLARVEATAKLVLATVALLGTLLTGFGALGSAVVADHPLWALPSLLLAATSVTLATLAAVGKKDAVNVDDLNEVECYYATQIAYRGAMVRWAGIALAAALLLAALPLARSAMTSEAVSGGRSVGEGGSHATPCQSPRAGCPSNRNRFRLPAGPPAR